MSDESVITLDDVGKMYKIYPSRLDATLDATGLAHFLPWKKILGREFWALRNINLKLKKGERIGIIGRNGAGKSTMLKLLTGNLTPTEGEVSVKGAVQALLTSGAGFHPEFTGYENIRSSLIYQGLTPDQIAAASREIAEFTELGEFLNQPFKVYSAGMQARLTFATATVLNPDILIVDEILGAGDAYFFGKSIERMESLVLSGATVLIVSHALSQIARFCERAIWIDRGRIVYHGPAMETINAYEEYIHKLEDRRLKTKNRKQLLHASPTNEQVSLSEVLTLFFRPDEQASDSYIDVTKIDLYEGDLIYEVLRVGDVQDTDASQTIYTVLSPASAWSGPLSESGHYFRKIAGGTSHWGEIQCYLYIYNQEEIYSTEINYRSKGSGVVEYWKDGVLIASKALDASESWTSKKIILGKIAGNQSNVNRADEADNPPVAQPHTNSKAPIRRWPSEGSLTIDTVYLLNSQNQEQTIYQVGAPLTIRIALKAQKSQIFTVRPAISLFRIDGIYISNIIADNVMTLEMQSGDKREIDFTFSELNLGDGDYFISISVFKDEVTEEQRYDLVARAYQFKVIGNSLLTSGYVFKHPGTWKLAKEI